jgi:holo-[acyl-carrier protein] synthase
MSEWNVGVDIVDVNRFRSLQYSDHKRFYKRVFTLKEIEYCLSFKLPAPHFAVNFAGKEAIYKAIHQFYDVDLNDIEILRDRDGAPFVNLNLKCDGVAKEDGKSILSPPEVRVSLSHSSSYAVAFAMAKSTLQVTEQ